MGYFRTTRDSLLLGGCCLVLCLIIPVGILGAAERADRPSSEDEVVVEGVDAIRLAILLATSAMMAQNHLESREILEGVISAMEFRTLPEEDRFAALFNLGQTLNALGEHREAARYYSRILAERPGLVRVRLELARSYFLLREDRMAEHHFRLALAGDLSEAVEANIRRYLWQIRQRRLWSVDLQVALVGNTNVNVAPTIREIEMYGLPFELNDEARARSGIGISTLLSGEYRKPMSETSRIRAGGYASHTAYQESQFNDTILGGHLGPHFFFDGGWLGASSISFLAHGNRRWFGGETLSHGFGPAVEWTFEPTDSARVAVRVERVYVDYDRRNDYDGTLNSAVIRPAFVITPASFGNLTLGLTYDRTDQEKLRNMQYRIGVGYHREMARGFTIGFHPEYRYVRYLEDWPAFGARRRDNFYGFRADIMNRRLELFGFTPVVGYRYQRRSSTIELYDFQQHRGELSLARQL